jgi:hypothetical protein
MRPACLHEHDAVARGPVPEQGTGPAEVDEIDRIRAQEVRQRSGQSDEICCAVGDNSEVPVRTRSSVSARTRAVQRQDLHAGHRGMLSHPRGDLIRRHAGKRSGTGRRSLA